MAGDAAFRRPLAVRPEPACAGNGSRSWRSSRSYYRSSPMVRSDDVNKLPRIGTRVLVPWGLGKAEGEVVDAYDSGPGARVQVEVDLGYPGSTLTVTFPLDLVEGGNAA